MEMPKLNFWDLFGGGIGYAAPRVAKELSGGDADWIPGISVRGGERNPIGGTILGVTDYSKLSNTN